MTVQGKSNRYGVKGKKKAKILELNINPLFLEGVINHGAQQSCLSHWMSG